VKAEGTLRSRATRVLADKGFYVSQSLLSASIRLRPRQEFWNWFDPTAWYPLGRVVGGTIYPGLMATSGVIYTVLRAINIPVDIRNICVMLAPGFSALTAWSTYMCDLLAFRIPRAPRADRRALGLRRR
jgi:dolichyl-diphosphooligosaccharide--protein glycosyltransferase